MALQISVAASGDSWTVHSDVLADDLTFEQGARAEAVARDLADDWARSGRPAEVRIFLRDGALVGVALTCAPDQFPHSVRAFCTHALACLSTGPGTIPPASVFTRKSFEIDSEATVYASAAMVALDWKRSITPALIPCLRSSQ